MCYTLLTGAWFGSRLNREPRPVFPQRREKMRKVVLIVLILAVVLLFLACSLSADLEKTIQYGDGKPHVNGEPTPTPKKINFAVPIMSAQPT